MERYERMLGLLNQELYNMVCHPDDGSRKLYRRLTESCCDPDGSQSDTSRRSRVERIRTGSLYLGLDICCIDIHYLDMDIYSEWFRSYMTARHCLHPSTSWSWYFRVFTVLQQTCKPRCCAFIPKKSLPLNSNNNWALVSGVVVGKDHLERNAFL